MLYLLLGLALLGGGLAIAYWFSKAYPQQILGALKVLAILVGTALAVALAVAGRAQFLLMLPILAGLAWKLWPLFGSLGQRLSKGGTSDSKVRTRFFKMTLDHGSGHVDGEILQGALAGRRLSELNLAELQRLRGDVAGDPQSLALIEAYLDRRDPDWRGPAGAGAAASAGSMTREEAYEVLGLEPGASPEAIRSAHRRLMQKLHPDTGGSGWFAAKLNAAKDLLLSR